MDEEIERLVVSVRADTSSFARDVDAMRATLNGPLVRDAERAGRAIEGALAKAVTTGKLGFEDLRGVVLKVTSAIADAAVQAAAISSGSSGGGSGASGIVSLLGAIFGGSPGRATGGGVSPDRPYWVGERGPELFVPTSAGQVMPTGGAQGGRDVRVAITVNAAAGESPRALAQSSRQVARAVRAALAGAD